MAWSRESSSPRVADSSWSLVLYQVQWRTHFRRMSMSPHPAGAVPVEKDFNYVSLARSRMYHHSTFHTFVQAPSGDVVGVSAKPIFLEQCQGWCGVGSYV